jgi:hypothetical protein
MSRRDQGWVSWCSRNPLTVGSDLSPAAPELLEPVLRDHHAGAAASRAGRIAQRASCGAAIRSPWRWHVSDAQLIEQEAENIGTLLDLLVQGRTDAMPGACHRPQQYWAIATRRGLQSRRHLS